MTLGIPDAIGARAAAAATLPPSTGGGKGLSLPEVILKSVRLSQALQKPSEPRAELQGAPA